MPALRELSPDLEQGDAPHSVLDGTAHGQGVLQGVPDDRPTQPEIPDYNNGSDGDTQQTSDSDAVPDHAHLAARVQTIEAWKSLATDLLQAAHECPLQTELLKLTKDLDNLRVSVQAQAQIHTHLAAQIADLSATLVTVRSTTTTPGDSSTRADGFLVPSPAKRALSFTTHTLDAGAHADPEIRRLRVRMAASPQRRAAASPP